MPKRQTPQSLSSLFTKSTGNLAQIAQKSLQLKALNQSLLGIVGDTIAQNCRVSNYTQGILTIETNNSAFATRLNFMMPQIVRNFRQNVLPELVDIYVKVVPNEQFFRPAPDKSHKSRELSEKSSDCILAVASNAPEGLKRKLERLASLRKTNDKS